MSTKAKELVRASYVPLYCGRAGPIRALLVPQYFTIHDRFVEVVIIDAEHLHECGVKLSQLRVTALVVQSLLGHTLRNDDVYAVYVRPT